MREHACLAWHHVTTLFNTTDLTHKAVEVTEKGRKFKLIEPAKLTGK